MKFTQTKAEQMQIKTEEVSPSKAAEWLKLSRGNRSLSENYVLSLAVAMEAGQWEPTASEIVFDDSGALIDGHHRLNAVVAMGKNIQMLVKRGVPASARGVIDTGRTRTIKDLLMMYRDVNYITSRRACLNTCVGLLLDGQTPPTIRTLDAYDKWLRHFSTGIDWAVGTLSDNEISNDVREAFRVGPVLGAFAFAHKTSPAKVESFYQRSRSGIGLTSKEPAFSLRNFAMSRRAGSTGKERRTGALKTLAAIKAAIDGRALERIVSNDYALDYFAKAYETKAIEKLVEPWTDASANGVQ